jgi:ferredoxin
MPHVVTEPCVGCKNTVCVTVCPVNCFHEDAAMLVIDPEECIDCGACVPECPTHAIFPLARVPPKWRHYIALNVEKAAQTPLITATKRNIR